MLADAARARKAGAQVVIASLHCCVEYQHDPTAAQVAAVHALLASPDIDLVIGHHAHVVQPFEKIDGKWVAYGLGNLVAQMARQGDPYDEVAARFTFTRGPTAGSRSRPPRRSRCTCRSVPAPIRWCRPTPRPSRGWPRCSAAGVPSRPGCGSSRAEADPRTRLGGPFYRPPGAPRVDPARAPPSTPIRVPAGTTAQQALKAAGVPLKGPDGAVVVRDLATGDLKDLAWAPDADAEVEPVPAASADGRAVIRHSTAHVLAQAVQELFPGTRLGIGPPIENGFYYDFDPERPFTPEDLQALEKKMQQIVRAGQRFSRREISDADAKAELAHEPYKLELIGLKGGADDTEGADVEVGGAQLTMYDNLDARTGDLVWTDLCRGPHLPRTSPSRRSPSPAAPPPTGGAARRTRSCSASTAPRGRARTRTRPTSSGWPRPSAATTAGSAPSWTCSASPTRSAPAWPSSTPRAG